MNSVFYKYFSPIVACTILLSTCLSMTSCAGKSSEKDVTYKVTAQNFNDSALSDIDEIKTNSNYDNLSFKNASLELPSNITGFSSINMSYYKYTQKDSIKLFEKQLNETFSNSIKKEDCFFNSPDIEVSFGDLTLEYPNLKNLWGGMRFLRRIICFNSYKVINSPDILYVTSTLFLFLKNKLLNKF